jgi:uncharacterized protein YndB with AHSA1/START domain
MWQTDRALIAGEGARVMSSEAKGEDFVIHRVFDAQRERVWQTLTDVEAMKHWWGPAGFTMITGKLDLRVGGVFHGGIRSAEGYKIWGKFVYQEIVPPQRLVFINSFSNEAGGVGRHPIIPTWPVETMTTLTLEEEPDGKTKLTVRWSPHNPTEIERKTFDAAHVGMKATWSGTFDRLAAHLAKG